MSVTFQVLFSKPLASYGQQFSHFRQYAVKIGILNWVLFFSSNDPYILLPIFQLSSYYIQWTKLAMLK